MPKITVIFPNYNGKEYSLLCLESLASLDYPNRQLEIIMVDNGSVDDSIKAVKTHFPKVKIIPLNRNYGFAKAVNQGITKGRGNYFLIANNDIIFQKNYLKKLIRFMETHPKTGIIGGKILSTDRESKILFCGAKFNPWLGSLKPLLHPEKTQDSDWIQGCAMLVKKSVFEKIGLFDESFFFAYEDLDFCQRAKKAGFRVIYFPKAVCWHKEGASIDREGLPKKAYEIYKSKFSYLFKNSTFPQLVTNLFIQFIAVAPIRTFLIKNPPFFPKSLLAAFWDGLIDRSISLKKKS